MKTIKHKHILPSAGLLLALLLIACLPGCEDYDDDPVFPASDFIAKGDYRGDTGLQKDGEAASPKRSGWIPGS
jgi:hypothetical protein